jgi:Tfp pilus assembly protein PilO
MRIPRDRKTLIAGGVTLALLAGGWFGAISPELGKNSELAAQTEASEASSEAMRGRLPLLRAQLDGIAPRVSELRSLGERVTATIDQPVLLEQLRAISQAAGIDNPRNVEVGLPSMITAPVAPAASASVEGQTAEQTVVDGEDTPSAPAPAASSVLASYNVTMEVRGSQAQVRAFLTGLQDGSRLIVVTSTSMQLDASDGTATMRIQATYFLQQVDVEGLASQIEALVAKDAPAAGPEAAPETAPTEPTEPAEG